MNCPMSSETFLIGLGSNLGDREAHLRDAVRALCEVNALFRVRALSPTYESDALLPEGAPADWNRQYLNAALLGEARPGAEPRAVLHALKRIESELGRASAARWAPRKVDLDLLHWRGRECTSDELSLPHPRWHERPFAVLPALDLWPDVAELALPREALAWRDHEDSPTQIPFHTRRLWDPLFPVWVGILNATPDSFSDGGALATEESVLMQARKHLADGATVLDVGAESTRPGADAVTPETEWERLAPVLCALASLREEGARFELSLDTRRAETLARASEHVQVDWINDVDGLRSESLLKRLATTRDLRAVSMHSLTVPPTPGVWIEGGVSGFFAHWEAWLAELHGRLQRHGIAPTRVKIDPGLGFGTSPHVSHALLNLRGLAKLRKTIASQFGTPAPELYLGHSRKSFLKVLTAAPAARDLETAVLAAETALGFCPYLRVHDVGACRRAVRAAFRTRGRIEVCP